MVFYKWLPIIIGVIAFIYAIYEDYKYYNLSRIKDWLVMMLRGLFYGFILYALTTLTGVLIAGCIGSAIIDKVETTDVVEWVKPIKSVGDNLGVESNGFVLGTGYVESNLRYYYIEPTDKGDIVNYVDAENCYLRESDKPVLEKHNYEFKNKKLELIADTCGLGYHVMKVPKDTVKYSYNIDLQ